MKKVTFITAFPEFLECFLAHSVIGRAVGSKTIEARVVNLRDFAVNRYGQVDDYAFGGGGMVLMAEPLAKALQSAGAEDATVIYPSPQGTVLSQELVESLAAREHLVLVCGHYEGVDERFVETFVDLEVSLGDFVLTGGELPAMVLVDAVARLVPGVVGKISAVEEDSFFRGMLDTPHFTRPSTWRGVPVPEVLLSGDSAAIEKWRKQQSVARTIARRPDLLASANIRPYLPKRPYLFLSGVTAALSGGLQLLERPARLYGFERILVVEPEEDRLHQLSARTGNAGEGEMTWVKFFKTAQQAFRWVSKKEKESPCAVGIEERKSGHSVHWLEAKRRILESGKPLIMGLAGDLPEAQVLVFPPRGGFEGEGELDPAVLLSICMDRFFGCR
ncbi:MAG: tRNA (guanosine(37)-N1)-methyltransferase TrmD [Synergistaceae bacterium]|nr:tRNA (guanosine(37)-N1)-methyltransferase TrmD [Synergistaceae bacterium]